MLRQHARTVRSGVSGCTVGYVGLLTAYMGTDALGVTGVWPIAALSYVVPWLFAPIAILLPVAVLLRDRRLLALLAIPGALFLLLYGAYYLPHRPAAAAGTPFTLLTYNINGLNRDADAIAAAITAHDPDVVALQEVNVSMDRAISAHLAGRYPNHYWERGMALYTRLPVQKYDAFRLGDEGFFAQQATLLVDGREVTVLNAHPRSPAGSPSGLAVVHHADDVRDLVARIDAIDDPLVVAGDLNLTDRHPAHYALAGRLRDAQAEVGRGMGFTFRPLRGGPAMWRIDYVLHSAEMVALDVEMGDYGGSDHRAVIARLAWR
ncbi:MAG: endonuclease/exonuclease/phosphatase family protein [Anaerolineae bacterium]|nr:endonuclease/exonuclease/phosphatase family protein [Anaerolineae bacterium]